MGALYQFIDLQTILVLVSVFIVVYLWQSRRSNLPPGPRIWPVVGTLPAMAGTKDLSKLLLELRKTYGDIIYLRLGMQHVVAVMGHRWVSKILTKRDEDFKSRPVWLHIVQKTRAFTGIINADGIHHQRMRKFVLLAMREFGVGKRSLEERIQDEAQIVADELAKSEGQPILLTNLLHKAVSNVICTVVFGNRFDYEDEEFLFLLQRLECEIKNSGVQNPGIAFPFLEKVPFGNRYKDLFECVNDTQNYINKQIDQHRATFDPNLIRDFIDIYLKKELEDENEGITEEAVFMATHDLFVAGSETTGTTLMWALLYMIRYPDVQKKCRKQIEEVAGSRRSVCLKDRQNLPYVRAILNEVSRIANIAPLSVPHATVQEVELNGYIIPKKCIVLPHIMSAHYDTEYWDKPEDFNPERWIDKDGQLLNHEAFYPFSLGSRSCVGEHLAKTELFLFFSTLMQHFQFISPESAPIPTLDGQQTGVVFAPVPFELCALSTKQ